MKKLLSFVIASLLFFSVGFAQVGLDRIGDDFSRHQPYPPDLQEMVDILTSPFVVVKPSGDLFGFTTYALATAYYTAATDVILNYGATVIDTGFVTFWAAGGAVVLATSGTDVACDDGGRYWVELNISQPTLISGIAYLVGSVGGTDSVIVEMYNQAGTLVATSDTTTVGQNADIVGTTAEFSAIGFDIAYFAMPGIYYVSVQFNGTTGKFRAYPIPGSKFITGTSADTWGTPAALTPGTSFTADKGPILHTY